MSKQIEQAMSALKKAMQDDPDYARRWHSAIVACVSTAIEHDRMMNEGGILDRQNASMDAATRVMEACFDVDTSQNGGG